MKNKVNNKLVSKGKGSTPEVVTPEVVTPEVWGRMGEDIGIPNLASKRITPGVALTSWRVVPNQRKNVLAKYYVQGGTLRVDPVNSKEMFTVCVEIPHTDLHTAKLQLVKLRAELTATTQVA